MFGWKTCRMIGCGVLLGTAGLKILTSKDAKKVYTCATAAVLRGTNEINKTITTLKENCEDIVADAKDINCRREEEEEARRIADAKEVLAQAEAKKEAEEVEQAMGEMEE